MQAIRREGDMVDLFLVSVKASNGFRGCLRLPQINGKVVAGRHQSLDHLAIIRRSRSVSLLRLGSFVVDGIWNDTSVIMICCP